MGADTAMGRPVVAEGEGEAKKKLVNRAEAPSSAYSKERAWVGGTLAAARAGR